ncbi:hypothetical protein [Pallidibacillus pasinlerensis]|uniref:Uncharacterized protein n=1 Tax=Pallidibacillus pasinlerensis TaxID=2703818 RepID=A0ABX0A9L7_9BACI|nr:hypothetical protein [Pallidibacillus pasinlerensis]NCU18915.1 hypothetical protein [Pallidibacillus pasinlerensis]
MKDFLNEIRKPISISLTKKFLYSTLIFIAGITLGLVSKMLETTLSNSLPYFLEVLDLRNFFSRMGVWLFLAVLISLYSKSALRSAVNVFLFFAGMVGSYYLFTVLIVGFFPKSYMMIWIIMTCISPFLAFVCWYAKGKGIIAISISSIIFMFITRQVFVFGFWYFDIRDNLELLLWIATIFVLYQSPKQIFKVLTIGLLLYFFSAQINLFWGML